MQTTTEAVEGIYLRNLDPGSILDVETTSRHYKIQYIGGDRILISGHPRLCPSPVAAELRGSLMSTGEVRPGFVGRGARFAFLRSTDDQPVVTSTVQDIQQEYRPN